MQWISAIYVLL